MLVAVTLFNTILILYLVIVRFSLITSVSLLQCNDSQVGSLPCTPSILWSCMRPYAYSFALNSPIRDLRWSLTRGALNTEGGGAKYTHIN